MTDQRTFWPYRSAQVLNMSTGPVEVSRQVLDAQLAPLLTPHVADFWTAHDETLLLLKQVLRTDGEVAVTQGSIRAGLDIALGNFVRPGSRILCLENGYWGHMIGDWAQARGGIVTRLAFDYLSPVDANQVREALQRTAFDLVTAVHVETNAGIVNPIEAIGAAVAPTGALFFVDTACSAGAQRVETDLWNIDVGVTGSHKCLASVPGLTVLTLSDKALHALPAEPRMGKFFSLHELLRHTNDRPETPPFTQSPPLIYALRESLRMICATGIEQWWSIHEQVRDLFIAQLRDAGFKLLPDFGPYAEIGELQACGVIAVAYPEGVDDIRFRQILYRDFGIFVIGNVGIYAGRSFRVGLMSPPQLEAVNVYGAVSAFEAAGRAARDYPAP